MSEKFSNNVSTLFDKIETFVTSKTVVGEPIYLDGVILLPLVDISFGVGAGTVETPKNESDKDGGGSGGAGGVGAKIQPSAVLVVMNGNVQLVNVKNQESVNKLIDLVPGVLSKLNLGSIFGNKDNDAKTADGSSVTLEKTVTTSTTEKDSNQ